MLKLFRYTQDAVSHARCLSGAVIGILLFFAMLTIYRADAAEPASQVQFDLTQMSLEQLMNIEVTTSARKPERWFDTPAAIFVITQEDIRRSGATNIPEALRMAPGVEVARIDANKWAVSIRGFNRRFADKVLVLRDGRNVYSPLFAGVFWEYQDTLLEDVDRIEVIRGPGGTLWGTNAVNGIINIITKPAQDTEGGLVIAGGGTEIRGFGAVRYGTQLGNDASIRAYLKYFYQDGFVDPEGNNTDDNWQTLRGGFRMDWQASNRDNLTIQGDLYGGDAGETLTVPSLVTPFSETVENDIDFSGGNILARWRHVFSASSEVSLQLYYDRTDRDEDVIAPEIRDTFDLDFQHRIAFAERYELVWGFGYRYTHGNFTNTPFVILDPEDRSDNLFSAFGQMDITLIQSRLHLILGSKFEHNDYSEFEYQPTARLLWTPDSQHTVWAAVTRAVKIPNRVTQDIRLNGAVIPPTSMTPPVLLASVGDDDIDSEKLLAFEAGYRIQPMDQLSLDIAAFYHIYDNLINAEAGMPFPEFSPAPPHVVLPLVLNNKLSGDVFGVELAATWRVLHWWRLHTAYSYLQMQLNADEETGEATEGIIEGRNPHHQLSVRSSMDLPWDLGFDLWLRYIDDLPSIDVDSYVTLDVRLAWKPIRNLEMSIVGQNLLESRHQEFLLDVYAHPVEIQRSVYGKITWHF